MAEDLFENAAAERMRKEAPLARRIALRTLAEVKVVCAHQTLEMCLT